MVIITDKEIDFKERKNEIEEKLNTDRTKYYRLQS